MFSLLLFSHMDAVPGGTGVVSATLGDLSAVATGSLEITGQVAGTLGGLSGTATAVGPVEYEADIVVRVRGRFAETPDAPYTIRDGGLVLKDPSDDALITFDWDAEALAEDVEISSSTFTIEALDVDDGSPAAALTAETESLIALNRSTQALFVGGTRGALYRISNEVTTDDGQIKERSILMRVEER